MKRYKDIRKLSLTILIILIGLSSCQVMNKYESPKIDDLPIYRNVVSKDTTTIASIPWKEFFQDSYLQSYIEEGIKNNFDMLIATQRIKQAEATLGMARATYFPEVALSAQVEQTRLSNADPLTGILKNKNNLAYHTENYTLGVTASWELDLWGKMNRQSKAKYADMVNSYAGRNLIQTSLIANIANTYYSILALDAQLIVTKDMIGLMQENLKTTEALKEAGLANGAAVEQTKATLYSVQISIPDLETNIEQLENALCTMIGRTSGFIDRSNIVSLIMPKNMAYGIPMQMLSKRPDVQQAELSFRAAFELTNAAQASFYPSITLTSGILGFSTTNGLTQFFKPENLFANIAGGLTQPIFARKRLTTQYKVAKYEQQATLLSFRKTVLAASQEVSNIISVYENSLKKNEERRLQVESLEKAVDYSHKLLKAGEATYLEVLSAEQGLLEAQLNSISDTLQQLQATSNLYRALGGGLQ